MDPVKAISAALRQTKPALAAERNLLRSVIDNLPDRIYVKDRNCHYLIDNTAHAQFLGADTPDKVIGKTAADFLPPDAAARYDAIDREIMEKGQPVLNREETVVYAGGATHWSLTTKVPLHDADGRVAGIIGISRDITERRRAQEALAREQDLLHALMDNIPDTIYFKDPSSRFTLVNRAQAKLLGLERTEDAIGKTDFDFFTPESAGAAFADDQRIMALGEPLIAKEEHMQRADGQWRWVTTTKMPFRDRHGKVMGLMGVSRDITERKLVERKVEHYAAVVAEKNAQLEADLHTARELQQAFLPQQYPRIMADGDAECALQFCHRYRPSAAVGGDFFDVLQLSESAVGVIICDVMGKGVQAALVTAMLRALLEELGPFANDPGRFLTGVSHGLQSGLKQMPTPMFATACYLVVDAATGELQYANAGHPSPLHVQCATGAVAPLALADGERGPALGMFEGATYRTVRGQLSAGDVLLLFTDGAFEEIGADGEEYGQQRFIDAVQRRATLAPAKLLDGVLAEVQQFSAHGEFEDDVCLVAVQAVRLGRPGEKGSAERNTGS
jgi:sigma-B regulation protein RsbU (phosphoserine phosphatase)